MLVVVDTNHLPCSKYILEKKYLEIYVVLFMPSDKYVLMIRRCPK